ncbi:MAG: hypothetical protein KatS3mg031_2960 [Chitinophagales bacterium]|nr:MAG: hypothetical protein KatS3mg031_2960 [Chitinophagales bacterium]
MVFMKVLIACEESQAITIELRKRGIEAYSCDLQPCSGGEILKVLHKHRDIIEPKQVYSLDYNKFGDKCIGLFGEKHGTINWSVDGRQPEDEIYNN